MTLRYFLVNIHINNQPTLYKVNGVASSMLAHQIINLNWKSQEMLNLENILQNSLFHHVDKYILKKINFLKILFLFFGIIFCQSC
jgi:hypothetical protein